MSNQLVRIPFQSVPASEPIDPYTSRKGRLSWGQIVQDMSKMTLDEVKAQFPGLLDSIRADGTLTLRQLVIARVLQQLILDPNPAMLNLIMERGEGKVPQMVMAASGNIGDWMEYAKKEGLELDEVRREARKILEENDSDPTIVEGEYVE